MAEPQAIARDEFFDSLLGDFLDESGQLLDRLNENLLQLDQWVQGLDDESASRGCDPQLLNEMFRSAHSLKGLSAMLGLTDINTLTHKVENVFDAARKNELRVNADVVELVFQAVDRLTGLVDVLKDPERGGVECQSVIDRIADLLPVCRGGAASNLAGGRGAGAARDHRGRGREIAARGRRGPRRASSAGRLFPRPGRRPVRCKVPLHLHRRDGNLAGRTCRDALGAGTGRRLQVRREPVDRFAPHQRVGGVDRAAPGGQACAPHGRSVAANPGFRRLALLEAGRCHVGVR